MEKTVDIGTGIYTVPEAARILELSPQKVGQCMRRYWEFDFLNDYKDSDAPYTHGSGRDRVFNFYTLIELITVSTFRELNVTFPKIKKAHRIAARVLKTQYPFAKKVFMTDGEKIIHNCDEITSLILNEQKQLAFREIIEPFCNKIDFDEVHQIAQRYWPMGRNRNILIDPEHRFGEPVIKGTNISVAMINSLIEAGESKSFIAEEYNISEEAVHDVIRYFDRAS